MLGIESAVEARLHEKTRFRSFLRLAGKSEERVAAVFACAPEACRAAVWHLRRGAPEVPVWLFSTTRPSPETAALCERVFVRRSSLVLVAEGHLRLWRRWVALAVAAWTGDRGKWPLKLAPFLIPPFRALLLNEHGDFLAGTPGNVWLHCRHRVHDRAGSAWHGARESRHHLCDRADSGWNAARGWLRRRVRDRADSAWHRVQDYARGYWRLVSYHIWRSGPVGRVKDVACGLTLLSVATVLRWCRYPHRNLFRRMHGKRPLVVSTTCGDGKEVEPFPHNGSAWNAAALERLALASNAGWILWRDEGAPEAADDLLPLFADARTFAVSRQEHFRGWKPALVPQAPFRALQPGEASQVLAPVAGTILVDRRKLVTLGIPRCGLAETAWMMLFWKAAAAGWRSYSIGQSISPTAEPDSPMQETAFAYHVLKNGMRHLGPREPDLARGSVAFVPGVRQAARRDAERLKVLIVSPFLPYPLAHGGAVRIWNLCRALADRVDFRLVAIREAQETVPYAKLHEVFREVYAVDIDERASEDRALPAQVRHHRSNSMRALIAELSRTWRPDLLQIEFTHMAAFRDSAPEVPALLVEHDVTFSLFHQLAEKNATEEARHEYQRWQNFERHWLNAYDAVWTVSEADRDLAVEAGRRSPHRTFAVPNGVDVARFTPGTEPVAQEILYVGSFRHLPNLLGFEKLCGEVMPLVWSRLPDARLRVVAGPQYERFWHRMPGLDARIEIHGFVEDLRPFYARAAAVVAPLAVSAGTNIKVLEAMACGKGIVTTSVGCNGLDLGDGAEVLIRETGTDFASAVCDLLSDVALRSRIGARARRTAEERFGWSAVAERAYSSYRAMKHE